MPDRTRPDKLTPVPTDTLTSLAKSLVNMETRLGVLMDDVVPELSSATKEARDGMIELRASQRDVARRLEHLESAPPPPHDCTKSTIINSTARTLDSHKAQLMGITQWRWWLMGAALSVALAATGGFVATLVAQGMAQQERTGLRRDVMRHESSIQAMQEARVRDREEILRAVSQVPMKVQKVSLENQTLDAVSDGLDRLPLKTYEVRQIRALLERAGRRETDGQ